MPSRTAEIFRKRLAQAVKASTIEVAEEAKANHQYKQQKGDLKNAVQYEFLNDGAKGLIYLDTNIAPYAVFVHEGTRPHKIFPRKRKALRWVEGSSFVFAKGVMHPGYKGDPFLYNAFNRLDGRIDSIFNHYIDIALKEVEHELNN